MTDGRPQPGATLRPPWNGDCRNWCACRRHPRQTKTSPARGRLEHSCSFQQLVDGCTGSEGRISSLKPSYGWDRTHLDGKHGAVIRLAFAVPQSWTWAAVITVISFGECGLGRLVEVLAGRRCEQPWPILLPRYPVR